MKTLMSVFKYLHEKDIAHLDIKPQNILIDNYNDMTSLKVCDFGLSLYTKHDTKR